MPTLKTLEADVAELMEGLAVCELQVALVEIVLEQLIAQHPDAAQLASACLRNFSAIVSPRGVTRDVVGERVASGRLYAALQREIPPDSAR